ncbi:type IV secretion protein, partial [Escherichia coli]
ALCILVVRQVPSIASALGGGVAMATQGAFGSAMNALRPTAMKRGMQNVNREVKTTQRALTSPVRGGQAAYASYQKRFGGNSVAQR